MIAPRIKSPIGRYSFPACCGDLLGGMNREDNNPSPNVDTNPRIGPHSYLRFFIDIVPLIVCLVLILAFNLPSYMHGLINGVCIANLYRLAVGS